MPYNTTAIPPRKEVTGQAQLPLTRVKKIIAADADVNICSNNAAFIITIATEMFIQHLASVGQDMAKLERKPRRNIQYKDLAKAVETHPNLEFLEDVIPKTTSYRAVRSQASATRARLRGEKQRGAGGADGANDAEDDVPGLPNGKKRQKSLPESLNGTGGGGSGSGRANGFGSRPSSSSAAAARLMMLDPSPAADEDPSAQLAMEMRQREGAGDADQDGDVDMAG